MKKFIRIAAFALAVVATVGLSGCKKNKADYSHSWRVVAYKAGGEIQSQRVGFKVTKKTDKQIKEIWVRRKYGRSYYRQIPFVFQSEFRELL